MIDVDHRDIKNEEITFTSTTLSVKFVEGGSTYHTELTLSKEINVDNSKYNVSGYATHIVLEKKETGFWKGVTKKDKAVRNLKVDWNNFVDPDEEEEVKKPEM